MVSKSCLGHLRCLLAAQERSMLSKRSTLRTINEQTRLMATVTEAPIRSSNQTSSRSGLTLSADPSSLPTVEEPSNILTTVYSFPNLEPLHFAYYSPKSLNLPLRRDILHRAVVYEGDNTRQGTASTKWRDEVHGSHRKLYQQKGTGKARVGDKQSPIRRGGGVAFGPKPRDFSTKLPKKMYDLAWRTALSYRYKKGQLIVVDRIKDLLMPARWWIEDVFEKNGWGHADGRSFLVPMARRGDNSQLFAGMEKAGSEGVIQEVNDVDVKDLLSMGRIIIEVAALNRIIKKHSSDIAKPLKHFGNQDPIFADPIPDEDEISEEDVMSGPSMR